MSSNLLEEVSRIVCEDAGYRTAWVGYAEHNEARVRLAACHRSQQIKSRQPRL